MRRGDLIQQLGAIAADLPAVLAPAAAIDQAQALCETARVAFGAAAASVAAVVEDELHYLAAAGSGADRIVGTTLPAGRGVGGYVAATGQALALDHASDDARFARDVAERTGYVPMSLLVVPIQDRNGTVLGVLSILDRAGSTSTDGADALALATSFAYQAALVLPTIADVRRSARLILDAIVDAVASVDGSLADALRRSTRLAEPDAELARIAAALADLRAVDAATRARIADVLTDVVALATPRRRR